MSTDSNFISLLEETLVFEYYRGGNYRAVLSNTFQSYPHMVVGQVVGNDLHTFSEEHGHYRVTNGSGYCAPAGCVRKSHNAGGRPAMFHWAHVNFFICHGIDLARIVQFPHMLPLESGKRIGAINRRLLELHEQQEQDLHCIVERKQLGMELLGILLQHRTDKSALDNKSMRTLQRMQPILQHMHEHVSDPLQAQHLAALFKLSFSRFHELFTQATGISPGQYQLRLRLQHAQILLASSDESISSIAEACGYTDNHYFSRIFKKTMGMTPGEWRRQYNTQQPV